MPYNDILKVLANTAILEVEHLQTLNVRFVPEADFGGLISARIIFGAEQTVSVR